MRSTVVVRAVDQQAFFDRVEHDLLAGDIQLDADHQSEAADFANEGVSASQVR